MTESEKQTELIEKIDTLKEKLEIIQEKIEKIEKNSVSLEPDQMSSDKLNYLACGVFIVLFIILVVISFNKL